jgi:phage repressor protein C with HTH and peptisase S24 domain
MIIQLKVLLSNNLNFFDNKTKGCDNRGMLKDRFKQARQSSGMSQEQLAEMTNVTQTSIYKIETGQTLRPRKLDIFAKALGVTPIWLEYGEVESKPFSLKSESNATMLNVKVGSSEVQGLGLDSSSLGASSTPRFIDIPVYDVTLAAGDGSFADYEAICDHYSISVETLERNMMDPKQALIVRVSGVSMQHTLDDGDMILINTSIKKPKNNKIFAFAFNEDLKVKRFFQQLDGRWRISSDNEDKGRYQDEYVSHNNIESLRLIGQVVTIVDRSLL